MLKIALVYFVYKIGIVWRVYRGKSYFAKNSGNSYENLKNNNNSSNNNMYGEVMNISNKL